MSEALRGLQRRGQIEQPGFDFDQVELDHSTFAAVHGPHPYVDVMERGSGGAKNEAISRGFNMPDKERPPR